MRTCVYTARPYLLVDASQIAADAGYKIPAYLRTEVARVTAGGDIAKIHRVAGRTGGVATIYGIKFSVAAGVIAPGPIYHTRERW